MRGRSVTDAATGPSSDQSVPISAISNQQSAASNQRFFLLDFLICARASRSRSATSSTRLASNALRLRRPFLWPTAYSQNNGNAIVESQYATAVSGSTLGLTLPQLTASAGVAPDNPPHTTESVVIWMK